MEPKPTPMETLAGEATVITSAGPVVVRQLKPRDYLAWSEFTARRDEGRKIELYCGKDAGWSDGLSFDDWKLVVTEGDRVNESFFVYCAERLARETKHNENMAEAVERVNPKPAVVPSPNLPRVLPVDAA